MKVISMFRKEGVIAVTVATIVSLFLVVSVVQAVTTISTSITTEGALSVTGATTLTGASTHTGLANFGQASSTRLSVFDTAYFGGTATTTINSLGQVASAVTRATGATGSFQNLAGDLTYVGAAGGASFYHAGVMGNFLGTDLTNTTASLHAGVIGSYNVLTDDDNPGGSAGVVGEVGDLAYVAAYAVLAVLGGDTGTLTPNAAYGVQYFNSTAASKFAYGLDLFHAQTTGYTNSAVDFGTADIRLQNGETISNATDGTIAICGALAVSSSTASSLAVGANGATNPVLQVDASTASVATGVKITGAAAGSSATLASISSGTDEKLLLNSKGRSEIRINYRTDSTTTGDFIGVQIKPGQGASKTAGNVIGAEISPRLNSGVALAASGSIIGAHIDTYLKGTATGTVNGNVRGLQVELVSDDP